MSNQDEKLEFFINTDIEQDYSGEEPIEIAKIVDVRSSKDIMYIDYDKNLYQRLGNRPKHPFGCFFALLARFQRAAASILNGVSNTKYRVVGQRVGQTVSMGPRVPPIAK